MFSKNIGFVIAYIFALLDLNQANDDREHIHIKLHLPAFVQRHTHLRTVNKHHLYPTKYDNLGDSLVTDKFLRTRPMQSLDALAAGVLYPSKLPSDFNFVESAKPESHLLEAEEPTVKFSFGWNTEENFLGLPRMKDIAKDLRLHLPNEKNNKISRTKTFLNNNYQDEENSKDGKEFLRFQNDFSNRIKEDILNLHDIKQFNLQPLASYPNGFDLYSALPLLMPSQISGLGNSYENKKKFISSQPNLENIFPNQRRRLAHRQNTVRPSKVHKSTSRT